MAMVCAGNGVSQQLSKPWRNRIVKLVKRRIFLENSVSQNRRVGSACSRRSCKVRAWDFLVMCGD